MLVPQMGRYGGSDTIVRGLSTGLIDQGWDVDWIVPRRAVVEAEPISHITYRGTGLTRGIRLAIGRGQLIHSHFAYTAWGHALLPAGAPRVRTFYGPWAEESRLHAPSRWKGGLKQGLERLSLARADRVIVLSEYSAAQAVALGTAAGKLRRVPGFIDVDRFPLARKMILGAESRNASGAIVTVRRLTPRTGVDRLIRAMALLPKRQADVRLQVVGDGPQRPELERIAEAVGMRERITFSGPLDDGQMSVALLAADLAVIPTVDLEGFGLATIEALWHGTPALVTAVGANAEVIGPLDASLIVATAEPEALAEGISTFLDRRPLWNPLRSREYVMGRFSLQRAVALTIGVYDELA
jgi:glycosyltransferase involved in cell wall biosynthesis